jgi:hypothetical protein
VFSTTYTEMVVFVCKSSCIFHNSAVLALLTQLLLPSPKTVSNLDAIVLFSMSLVYNSGRHDVNSIIVCSTECIRRTQCKGLWMRHFLWDFRFSRRWVWRGQLSEKKRLVISDDRRPDDGVSAHLWNVGLLQRDYTALSIFQKADIFSDISCSVLTLSVAVNSKMSSIGRE